MVRILRAGCVHVGTATTDLISTDREGGRSLSHANRALYSGLHPRTSDLSDRYTVRCLRWGSIPEYSSPRLPSGRVFKGQLQGNPIFQALTPSMNYAPDESKVEYLRWHRNIQASE